MNKGDVEIIREGLKQIASKRFAENPIRRAGANIAVDAVCDAKIAEADILTNTISSYSIQGRSITKRNVGDIPWGSLLEDLAHYFTDDEIPFHQTGNAVISVDFSGGAR